MKETTSASAPKVFNALPLSARSLPGLLLSCLVILTACPILGAESSTGAIGPGMVLKDMVIPLSLSSDTDPVVLSASEAKTLDPPHLLRLERAKSVFGDRAGGYTSIHVKNAVFDLFKKEILSLHETNLLFHVSNTLNQENKISVASRDRDSKSNQSKSSNSKLHAMMGDWVDASGSLFAEVKVLYTKFLLPEEVVTFNAGRDFFVVNKPLDYIFSESPTRLKLVQEACASLADFYKCWPLAEGTKTDRMGCFSKNGGRLASIEKGVTINGPAIILSEAIVLGASDGIFLHRKQLEGHEVMETHLLANNGVKAVISDGKGDVAIDSQSFKHVVESRVSQFEGGPVVMRRNDVTLVAEEPWQFVRIFDYHRVVLSPGKWQMIGSLKPDEASDHR